MYAEWKSKLFTGLTDRFSILCKIAEFVSFRYNTVQKETGPWYGLLSPASWGQSPVFFVSAGTEGVTSMSHCVTVVSFLCLTDEGSRWIQYRLGGARGANETLFSIRWIWMARCKSFGKKKNMHDANNAGQCCFQRSSNNHNHKFQLLSLCNLQMTRDRQRKSHYVCRTLVTLLFILSTIPSTATASAAGEPLFHQTCNSDAQCLHGGTCRYTETGQGTFLQCQCADGYTGSRCEHYCSLQCQHGGICRPSDKDKALRSKTTNNKSDFVCRCMGYFTGRLCETPYENCNEGVRCYNNGKCHENENDHRMITRACECPPEWTGPSCETRAYAGNETAVSANAPLVESSSGRTVLWVFLALCGLVGVLWVISHRKKWRSRRWRYNAVTRKAVAKFRDFQNNDAEDTMDNQNLHDDDCFQTSNFRDVPEYRNVI